MCTSGALSLSPHDPRRARAVVEEAPWDVIGLRRPPAATFLATFGLAPGLIDANIAAVGLHAHVLACGGRVLWVVRERQGRKQRDSPAQ